MFDGIEHTSKYCAALDRRFVAVKIVIELVEFPCPSAIDVSYVLIARSPSLRPHVVLGLPSPIVSIDCC
jgi:hypothetical protein